MNDGQKKFHDFLIERSKSEHQEEVEKMLEDNFKKQEAGTFNEDDLEEFHKRIIPYLKPECIEEVVQVMTRFGPNEVSS